MTTDTSGNTNIDSEKILTFPSGIPGFEKYTKFILFHKEENNISAYWLESCDKPEVTFTLVDPEQYGLSYDLELSEEEQKILKTEDAEKLGVFLILSKEVGKEVKNSGLNANIAGPIIINPEARIGLQKVINKPRMNALVVDS